MRCKFYNRVKGNIYRVSLKMSISKKGAKLTNGLFLGHMVLIQGESNNVSFCSIIGKRNPSFFFGLYNSFKSAPVQYCPLNKISSEAVNFSPRFVLTWSMNFWWISFKSALIIFTSASFTGSKGLLMDLFSPAVYVRLSIPHFSINWWKPRP